MDANHALDDLLRVSDDIRSAVVFERGGEPVASNLPDDEAEEVAGLGDAMLAYAETLRAGVEVRQLVAMTPGGDIYVVRDGDDAVVAVTDPGSLAGLVQHDLQTLLGSGTRRRQQDVVHA